MSSKRSDYEKFITENDVYSFIPKELKKKMGCSF